MRWTKGQFEVDTDLERLDLDFVHKQLKQTYWGKDRSKKIVQAGFRESKVVFGLYDRKADGKIIGFTRAVSDTTTFAWLADVFIDSAYRGKGLGKFLMRCVLKHPDCGKVRQFFLGTRDAHGLYEQFGWQRPPMPELYMVRATNTWWSKKRS